MAQRLAPEQAGRLAAVPAEYGREQRSVDTALTIEVARLAVTTRLATKTLLMRQIFVTSGAADQLLARLQQCKVITAAGSSGSHKGTTTPGQLPSVVEEFMSCDGDAAGDGSSSEVISSGRWGIGADCRAHVDP